MFLIYVQNFFKKGDNIQGGTLLKGGHYLRKYGMLNRTYRKCRNYVDVDYFLIQDFSLLESNFYTMHLVESS